MATPGYLRHLLCAALMLATCGVVRVARAEDAKQFVRQAVQSELRADQSDHSHWLYYETDRKPNNSVEQWVAEISHGDLTRVVEKNGEAIPSAEQRSQMQQFIDSPQAQARQRRDGKHDDAQATKLLKLLPNAFVWTDAGTQGQERTLHFKPDPAFHPPSREARVFAAMEGDMVVNTAQFRIVSLKGRLVHDVTFGFGIFGRLKAGGTFDVERRETGPGVWQITQSHIHVHGHELLFKTISEQEDDVKSKFKPLPGDLSLQQAEQELLKQGS